MVTASVLYKESRVITRRAERALRDVNRRKNPVCRSSWVLDTEAPRPIAFVTGCVHIATELNQEITQAPIVEDGPGAIHRIAFPDTAEVHDHAFTAEEGCAVSFVHFEVAIIDELSPADNFIVIWNRAVLILIIEFPKARHHAECDVEFSAGPFAHLTRCFEHISKFGSNQNRMLAGGCIQPLNIATLLPIAQQPFETFDFLEDGLESSNGSRLIGGPRGQPKLGPHRRSGSFDEVRDRRRGRLGAGGKKQAAGRNEPDDVSTDIDHDRASISRTFPPASQCNFLCILCSFLVGGFAGGELSLASFVIEMKGGRVMGRVMRWLIVLMLIAVLPAGAVRAGDSPVAKAAKAGDLAAVRKLIATHADANIPEGDGSTALLWAAYYSDLEMLRVLVAAGAKLDTANHYGVTPLLQASRTGDTAVMEALLKAGANPSLAHPDGETPLMAASRSGHMGAVRLLLDRGANVNAAESSQQETALMWAAAEGHIDVVDALLKAGADPNRKAHVTSLTERKNADHPTGGFTALMWAARNGHDRVVRRLIEAGADVNATNGDGATAMTIAIVNDRFDLAATLLGSGANANDGSLYQAVEMHDATTDWYARDGSQLRANHPNQLTAFDLVKLLLEKGADPNQPFVGQLHSAAMCCDNYANATPFYRAAVAADVETMKLMIDRGANLEWTPTEIKGEAAAPMANGGGRGANANVGKPPALVAMTGGQGVALSAGPGFNREGPPPFREKSSREPLEAVKLLLKAGANPNAKSADGSTLVHQAAQAGNLEMIRTLAQAGAKLDAPNKDGLTALDVAEGKQPAGARGERGRGADATAAAGGGRGRGRGAASQKEVAALLRELMGLPPAPPEAAAPSKPSNPSNNDGGK